MDIADLIGIIVVILVPLVSVGIIQMLVDHKERKQKVKEELDKMWNRIEWLCKDTDDRLSADRVELQQRAMQIKNLQKRVKRAEGFLYIDARDAFKEDADGNGKEVEP